MRDRDLVRLHWPVELRPAFDALFGVDDAMGDVVLRSTQPALAAIKLAWWRERLEELDEGKAPAEPRLQAAARELLPRGIKGAELAELEGGWAELLSERPNWETSVQRGASLFRLAGRLLGARSDLLDPAGMLFAAIDLRRRSIPADFWPTRRLAAFPRSLRPISALAALARRDVARTGPPDWAFEPEATPGRAWTLLRHRLTGRI